MKLPTDKKYNIILADPPWKIGFYTIKGNPRMDPKFRVTPYQGMEIEDIKKMPVAEMADENCALFLWITYPCLQWGLDVMKAWGFKYKTVAFTWVKRTQTGNKWFVGLGNYTKANAEICLLGTKGIMPRKSKKVKQIIIAPVTEHSKKPYEAHKRILKLFGDLPRIELFARNRIPGWDFYGDDSKLKMEPLEAYL